MHTEKLFVIQTPAPITQYQDLGRIGYLDQGFSHSGPMDERAFAINNALLGNAANATQLEIAPGGLQLKCLADCSIAVAGAYLNPSVNGKPLVNFCATTVHAGDCLRFGFSKHGQFAYLGVAGGFLPEPFLGSRSTTARLHIFPGGELTTGSYLIGQALIRKQLSGAPRNQLPDYRVSVIDVLPAFHYRQFSESMRAPFSNQPYHLDACDRMGTRLTGAQPINWSGGELFSEGLLPGAIQIPPDGNPIILQKDAQSIGGYPKIGCLPPYARSLLAQKKVGETVYFRWLDDNSKANANHKFSQDKTCGWF